MAASWERVDAVFGAACEQPEAERASYVATACANEPEVAAEVMSLLAAAAAATAESLGALVGGQVASLVRGTARAGKRVGPYRLGELLGEGGMGVVYAAQREDGQFAQRVAIKILKHGVSPERFRDERQILATLAHPNIVKLLDGGTTDDGLPYLVMERIDGAPITAVARTREANLRLMREVCEAVHHAHGTGVIHRDLKPSNLLVDAHGVVKLLDFGIAKLGGDDREARTQTGAAVMTPQYASPEQLRGEPATVASDVYALGAILYELATGTPMRTGTLADVLRAGPIVWPAAIPHDLAAIAMTALADEPAQRYASAEALADDLGRYLANLPVRARRPSLSYRAGKLARRHIGKLVAGGLVVVAAGVAIGAIARAPASAWQPEIEPIRWRAVDDQMIPDALSPDGRKLAFVTTLDGRPRQLVVLDVASGTHEIVDGDVFGALRWTVTGDGLIYLRQQHSYRRGYPSGPVEDLGVTDDDIADCGDTLARLHEDLSGQWVQIRGADGTWQTLHRLHADEIGQFPRCDPASKRILVASSPSFAGLCAAHAVIVERDGRTREVGEGICTATFVPGGKSIVYASSHGGRINLFELDIDSGVEHALTTGAGPDLLPEVSQDGSTLAFAVDPIVSSIAFEDDKVELRGDLDRVRVTRDGSRVIAQQEDPFEPRLWVVTLGRGEHEPRRLVEGLLVLVSADDRRVYFRPPGAPEELRVLSIDGGPSELVARMPGRIIRGADGPGGIHVLVERDNVLSGWHVLASGQLEADGVDGLVVEAPTGGWRAVVIPGEGWHVRLVPPGGVLASGREIAIATDPVTWVDDHTLATAQECEDYHRCAGTLDVGDGTFTRIGPGRDGLIVVAGDGRHWVNADSSGRPQRQLITNFGARPWR